jgi:hypothetical protein
LIFTLPNMRWDVYYFNLKQQILRGNLRLLHHFFKLKLMVAI